MNDTRNPSIRNLFAELLVQCARIGFNPPAKN